MRIPLYWRFIAAAFVIAATSCDSLPTETGAPSLAPERAVVIGGYTIGRDPLPFPLPSQLSKSEIIGPAGGIVTILGHTLKVPAGAVPNPTIFTIAVQPTGLLEVDLTAIELPPIGLPHEITQFNEPVRLILSYARSRDHRRLRFGGVIIHVDGLNATPLRTYVRGGQKKAVADLHHFSKYMMASN